jgi:phosphatidylglycerophosphatase C
MCCASSPSSPARPDASSTGDAPRGGSLAVFDLDGTITRSDTFAPFVLACLRRHPWRLPRLLLVLPVITRFLLTWDRGALKGGLLQVTLGGLTRGELQQNAAHFVQRLLRRGLYRQALQALESHRARGAWLVLMSASPDLYVPQVGAALGFDQVICTQVRWREDGRLDGRLASTNCRGLEKQRRLSLLIERMRPERVYGYGNSRSDLPHLQLAHEAYLVNRRGSLVGCVAPSNPAPPGSQASGRQASSGRQGS